MTYVSTWSGWVYVAFVVDAYARRILGWRTGTSMTTQLVLDAVDQAIWTRHHDGCANLSGLVHRHDHGSQYTSLAFSERLAAAGIRPSVGAVGSSFDNALAETINGLYKTELIRKQGLSGGASNTSSWRPPNRSSGSTTAAFTSTAATSRRRRWRTLTTLRSEPSNPLSSQTVRSPDTPGRFTGGSQAVLPSLALDQSRRRCSRPACPRFAAGRSARPDLKQALSLDWMGRRVSNGPL